MSNLVADPEQKEIEKELRQAGSMSLLQHLEELRKCIIRSAAAVAVGFGGCRTGAEAGGVLAGTSGTTG